MQKQTFSFSENLQHLTIVEASLFVKNLIERRPNDFDRFMLQKYEYFEDFIGAAFLWDETPEGNDYWWDISRRVIKRNNSINK